MVFRSHAITFEKIAYAVAPPFSQQGLLLYRLKHAGVKGRQMTGSVWRCRMAKQYVRYYVRL